MDSTSGERFKVVFYGQLDDKKEKSLIQDSLVKKLKMSEKAATNLLKCSTAIVKKNLPESSARKYIAAFENVGVFLELEPMSVVESSQVDSKNAPVEETKGETKLSLVAVEDTQEVAATEAREDSAEDGDSEPEEELEFKFDGNGFEYFKIWIVNIVLTILTLGIYSAWAKVRNQQYFYGHTELTGTRFEYLAKPINILIGRLLVVPVVIAGNFLSESMVKQSLAVTRRLRITMCWVLFLLLRLQ